MRTFLHVSRFHIIAIASLACLTFGWLFSGERLWAAMALCALDWFIVNLTNRVADLAEDRANKIAGTALIERYGRPLEVGCATLLIGSLVAVHFVMLGLGLWFFGAEGSRTPAFTNASFQVGDVNVSGQSLLVLLFSLLLIGALYLFFDRTLYGKALRATALNRVGARLVGVSPNLAGSLTFTLAALLGGAWVALVLFAAMATKQHYAVDVVAGVFIAVCADVLARRYTPRIEPTEVSP